jgi:uncharacterized membrane protein
MLERDLPTVPAGVHPNDGSVRRDPLSLHEPPARPLVADPLVLAGLVSGLGFGGFADGIVLHQILGWHHLVCTTQHCQPTSIEHLQRQNTQDGFFHAVVWVLSLAGTALLFRAAGRSAFWSGRVLAGAMLAGWGAFNFVEGLIDHHLLGIHHVRPGHAYSLLFDLAFLASGPVLVLIGWAMIRRAAGDERSPR